MSNLFRLRNFITGFAEVVDRHAMDEAGLLESGRSLLAELIRVDDWLPDPLAQCSTQLPYSQYLLYCDPKERFSVVSFVFGPGQGTPIHNHTVWGLVGVLRGAEITQHFARQDDTTALMEGRSETAGPGAIEAVSPDLGDIHIVRNAYADKASVSIHVYGANIGTVRRSVYDRETGVAREFVSGYSNQWLPNLWNSLPHEALPRSGNPS